MKKTKLILSLVFGLFFVGCNSNSISEKKIKMDDATPAEHLHVEGSANSKTIELNNGAKWKINEEMKPFVTNGSLLVIHFIRKEGADYKKLAARLMSENDQLIKSCTMNGKSHEELHKWLAPHLALVEKLEKTSNGDEAGVIIRQVEKSYLNFQKYFQ